MPSRGRKRFVSEGDGGLIKDSSYWWSRNQKCCEVAQTVLFWIQLCNPLCQLCLNYQLFLIVTIKLETAVYYQATRQMINVKICYNMSWNVFHPLEQKNQNQIHPYNSRQSSQNSNLQFTSSSLQIIMQLNSKTQINQCCDPKPLKLDET